MAVAHVASATMNEAAPTTTGTITIPASVVSGHDLWVVGIGDPGLTCVDDDAGGDTWTFLGAEPTTGNLNLWHKKATAGSASKTVTIANSVDSVTGGLSAFSGGLASGDPTTNLSFESNASGNETHLGFTPTHADSMICFCVGSFEPLNLVTLMACTDPGSLEPELWERGSTGGADVYAILAARIQVGGPTVTGSFTWAQTNASTRSLAFAIRPEVAAAGGGSRNRLLLGVG